MCVSRMRTRVEQGYHVTDFLGGVVNSGWSGLEKAALFGCEDALDTTGLFGAGGGRIWMALYHAIPAAATDSPKAFLKVMICMAAHLLRYKAMKPAFKTISTLCVQRRNDKSVVLQLEQMGVKVNKFAGQVCTTAQSKHKQETNKLINASYDMD